VKPLVCPKCSTEFVKRVIRNSFRERLLRSFHFYAFRCQICRFRFRALQLGITLANVEKDRREYERLAMNAPISFVGENIAGAGTVADISINGCGFATDVQLNEASIVRLSLQISHELEPVIIDAAVVRYVQHGRAGVEFLRVQPAEQERLRMFIRGLRQK
jgi:hypothetical protein